MAILLSTYGSRGDVEPMAGLAFHLRELGVDVRVSAPPDEEFVDLLARTGVVLAPAFLPVRQWIADAKRTPTDLPSLAAKMIAAQYDAIGKAAVECDAIVATGLFPSAAAAQCVAEKRGVPYSYATFCPLFLPSHRHPPFAYPGHPLPPEVTDNRALWGLNVETMNALFGGAVNTHRASIGLPIVDNVRDHVFTDRPFLASDPLLWPWERTDLCDAIQTGAWILPDERPLPAALLAFLDAGPPPVYVGFGSMASPTVKDAARAAMEAIRAEGRRALLLHGWANLAPTDDQDDCFIVGEVNQQALFGRVAAVVHHGGAGTTVAATRAGAPHVIVPQIVDQPFWARRVADLGIGVAHDGPAATVESLSTALRGALSPGTRAQAGAVAGRTSADGAITAARRLLDMVGREAPTAFASTARDIGAMCKIDR